LGKVAVLQTIYLIEARERWAESLTRQKERAK
jgi:hypothetical protein